MPVLSTLFDQINIKDSENVSAAELRRRVILDALEAQFRLTTQQLRAIKTFLLYEMNEGLRPGVNSTLKMLPSFVYKTNPSKCHGAYYALDFGGTNLRTMRIGVNHGKIEDVVQMSFKIPQKHIIGEGSKLFDFIAGSLNEFLESIGRTNERKTNAPLGFTFSFPTRQDAIDSGVLLMWTKEFSASGVEGMDVVKLLQDALNRCGLAMQTTAICNDTVGTLIARYFSDHQTQVGLILGTGTNGCYWERISAMSDKYPQIKSRPGMDPDDDRMCVNMEFGNFDSTHMAVLPETTFDAQLDAESENPKAQRIEKMMGGKYLGELIRLILAKFASIGLLVSPGLEQALAKPYTFTSELGSKMVEDGNPGLERVGELLALLPDGKSLKVTPADRQIVWDVCQLVFDRAAQLAASVVSGILQKPNVQYNATVAVDGSVFEKVPGFRQKLEETLHTLLPEHAHLNLSLTHDGSGVGAGLIAALEASK